MQYVRQMIWLVLWTSLAAAGAPVARADPISAIMAAMTTVDEEIAAGDAEWEELSAAASGIQVPSSGVAGDLGEMVIMGVTGVVIRGAPVGPTEMVGTNVSVADEYEKIVGKERMEGSLNYMYRKGLLTSQELEDYVRKGYSREAITENKSPGYSPDE